MKNSKRRWVIIGAIAGVIAAIAAVVALTQSDDNKAAARGNTTASASVSGHGNCAVTGAGNIVQCPNKPASQTNEEALEQDAKNYASVKPTGTGPWEFVVVNDMDIGLKVRTTPAQDGVQIGGLQHLHPAWAVCKQHSGFNPEGLTDLWIQIKWANQAPSTDFFESEFSAPTTGWAISTYLLPVNHNGDIPDC